MSTVAARVWARLTRGSAAGDRARPRRAGAPRADYAWTAAALASLARPRVGRRGEELCADLLEARGFRVVARRLRTPRGELDLVARRGARLWCIEVKSTRAPWRGGAQRITPADRLSAVQRARLRRAAGVCARELGERRPPRLALVEVWIGADGRPAHWRVSRVR